MDNEIRIHRLDWTGEEIREADIRETLLEVTEDSLEEIQERIDGCWTAWPQRTKQVAALSRKWPGERFVMECQGMELKDRFREHYRNGQVQREEFRWSQDGFDPDRPAEPGGPGTLGMEKLHRTSLPEHPGFQCSGAGSGFDQLEAVHFQDDTGAIRDPGELWYAELVDDEYAIEGCGFLCSECLEAAGIRPEGRPTLLEEMARRATEKAAA